jgi:transcriptional regulator with XRE-family HTH domain
MRWAVASDIGNRIVELRDVLGIDGKELAESAGVLPSQLSVWIHGPQRPPRSRLDAWAKREGWPVEIFAEGGAMPSAVASRLRGSRSLRLAVSEPAAGYGAPRGPHDA